MNDKAIKTGYLGEFKGWRLNGKSYDPQGNEIPETHEKDCLCCRNNLLTQEDNK